MISRQRIEAFLARFPLAAVAAYLALIVVFVFITVDGALQVLQRRDAAAAASEILTRIEVRHPARAPAAPTDVGVPLGSPFIEGTTVSVAGAALLRRLTAATKRMNGNTLSSQVDLHGPRPPMCFHERTPFPAGQASPPRPRGEAASGATAGRAGPRPTPHTNG